MAYLYGASIQGIQGFIFETNRLKEIVGASDLVEWFVSEDFIESILGDKVQNDDLLRNAGGNIRLKFKKQEDAQKMVKSLPKTIMQDAYGITVSQAVVAYKEDVSIGKAYLDAVSALERKLNSARNRASLPLDSKFALMKQCNRTGKPLYKSIKIEDDKVDFDKGSWQKHEDAYQAHSNMLLKKLSIDKSQYDSFTLEMSKISNTKNKIAVIHADGNNMGLLLQKMKTKLTSKSPVEIQKAYKTVSKAIETATLQAVKYAYDQTYKSYENTPNIPFRPIVIGGDDLTVVCEANEAMAFTKIYLEQFENYTKENFADLVEEYGLEDFQNGLTACAGIAYTHEKFPFHYAVNLAEALCGYVKEASNREASCLAFHNVQSSYFTDYKAYIKKELTIRGDNSRLLFAPYYLSKPPSIDALMEACDAFRAEGVPLGKFREWLNELHKSTAYAELYMDRIVSVLDTQTKAILNEKLKGLSSKMSLLSPFEERDGANHTPIHEIIQLIAVTGGKDAADK